MPRSRKRRADHALESSEAAKTVIPVPASAAFSFLKQTRGLDTWIVGDFARMLHVSKTAAEQAASLLALQGYVKRQGSDWTTTPAGHSISGSKMPRLNRETVIRSLDQLANRIKTINRDSSAPYRITRAVAFGDFLNQDLSRVQPADVGVELISRGGKDTFHSATETKTESAFLQHLRGRSSLVHLVPFEEWMQQRTHQKLF